MALYLYRKKAFGDDAIERITFQNTNNRFDELLAKTKAVQNALIAGITDLAFNRAVREARTKSANSIMKDFTSPQGQQLLS